MLLEAAERVLLEAAAKETMAAAAALTLKPVEEAEAQKESLEEVVHAPEAAEVEHVLPVILALVVARLAEAHLAAEQRYAADAAAEQPQRPAPADG